MLKNTITLIMLPLLVSVNVAFAQQAQLIWSQEEHFGSRIQVSDYEQGQWQAPETIVFDYRANILPTLTATENGRIAVWSVVTNKGSQLYYSVREAGKWQSAKLYDTALNTNLAPVLVHDAAYTPWLFWAANSGDDDDIYYAVFKNGQWSKPALVHADNQLVDILPQASVDNNGTITVSWQQLDDDKYVEKNKVVLEKAEQQAMQKPTLAPFEIMSSAEVKPELPAFFKSRSRASLYMPNKLPASETIKGNIQ